MEAALAGAASDTGFRDGLGERKIISGSQGEPVAVLYLRPELTAVSSFEFALRERCARLANFQHASYARVRQIDRLAPPEGSGDSRLAVLSDHVPGWRLSEILSVAAARKIDLNVNAALALVKQLVNATAILHRHARGVAHGAIAPERLILTSHARLVVVEHVLGAALERLQATRERLWRDYRLALPPAAGVSRFDHRADVTQVGAVSLALVLGRPLADDEYPQQVADVLAGATENRSPGGRQPLTKALRTWLSRALQLDLRHSFPSAIEAQAALDAVFAEEPGYVASPVALESFLSLYQKSPTTVPAEPVSEVREPVAVVASQAPPVVPAVAPAAPPVAPAARPVAEAAPPSDPAIDLAAIISSIGSLETAGEKVETAAAGETAPAPNEQDRSADAPSAPAAPAVPAPAARAVPAPAARAVPTPAPTAPTPAAPAPAIPPPAQDGYPGAFETLFGGAKSDTPPAPSEIAREESIEVDEPKSRRPLKKLVLGLVAVGVLAIGGYPAYLLLAPGPPPPAADGRLSVESRPVGLPVIVDGKPRGVTPLTIALPPGQHRLELQAAGETRQIPITMSPGGQVSQYIEAASAAAATGRLQVTSEPPGAAVLVDGERKGVAPLVVSDLAPGRHRVDLQSDAGTVQQEVTIEAGGTHSLVIPMTPRNAPLSGWVAIKAPVDLQIFEGGQLLGTTQTERILVTAGRHDLDLVNETLAFRVRQTVQVGPGRTAPIQVQLPMGSLSVNAVPWAEVVIDGERKGETPLGNISLPIGPHEVVFRHPQFGEQRHAIVVKAGVPARVSVDLRK